jgi:hypothetical protein
VAADLAVKPTPAKAEARDSSDLPALSSSTPPERNLSTPSGDFSNEPPAPGRPGPEPRFEGYDSERSTVVARRENRTTYANPDGSRTTRAYSGPPVNFKDSTGAWKPIDTTIEADPAGG